MIERHYSFNQITRKLVFFKNYINYREIFILFAVRRKVRLMSFLINSNELTFKFESYMIIDVMANDVYDIAMLLYREYFLKITEASYAKIIKYLTTSFMKTGQTEEKLYMYIRLLDRISLDEATKFINTLQSRVSNKSKSNIFLVCLNVVKTGCLLIQLVERLREMYPALNNRAFEIRKAIVDILFKYLSDVKTIEEVRHLLLSKDLDHKDALTYISEFSILELLEIPFVSEIAECIWKSSYNLRGSIFIASTNHNLLFNFNHTRYDVEGKNRFYNSKDIKAFGCHDFQFMVWRHSPRSRYYAELLSVLLFVIIAHVWTIDYLDYGGDLRDAYNIYNEATGNAKYLYLPDLDQKRLNLYYKALDLTYIGFVFCQLFLQNIFRSIYTGYVKQQMIFYTVENAIDTAIFFLFLFFITITYRLNLRDTWFRTYSDLEEARIFSDSYLNDGFDMDALIVT